MSASATSAWLERPNDDGDGDATFWGIGSAWVASRVAVIGAAEVALLLSALLPMAAFAATRELRDVIGCYLMSLATADLVCALTIVPLALYAQLEPLWRLGGDDSITCKAAAYIHTSALCSTAYTLAWICIDRYSAMMKPSRYADQSLTRCKCWIVFSWLTSLLLCSPILLARMHVVYSDRAALCVLDFGGATAAYSSTLLLLVLTPTLITVVNAAWKISHAARNPHTLDDAQRVVLETDANFVLASFLFVTFLLAWTPLLVLKFFEWADDSLLGQFDVSSLGFIFTWLALAGPSAKLLIYLFTNAHFRRSLFSCRPCVLVCCVCCPRSWRARLGYYEIDSGEGADAS